MIQIDGARGATALLDALAARVRALAPGSHAVDLHAAFAEFPIAVAGTPDTERGYAAGLLRLLTPAT